MPESVTAHRSHDRAAASDWSADVDTGPILLATSAGTSRHVAALMARIAADASGSELHVVSVVEPSLAFDWLTGAAIMPPMIVQEGLSEPETAVRSFLDRTAVPMAPYSLTVRSGAIKSEIAMLAQELSPSLVVVGGAPHTALGVMRAGTLASQLLRSLNCPVLAAMPPAIPAFQRVMAAIDFSPASVRAARAGLRLMQNGGTFTLLHVEGINPFAASSTSVEDDVRKEHHHLLERLRDEMRRVAPDGVSIETHEMDGDPEFCIPDIASTRGVQLICVGTHGGGPIDRLILGSVATSVFRSAMCSVLGAGAPAPDASFAIQLTVQGCATSSDPQAWERTLAAFSRRNSGRRVRLEVDDPEVGAQTQAIGYQFFGATFDAHERRLEIMLQASGRSRDHLTRSIMQVSSISITRQPDDRDAALEVRAGATTSRLSFLADMR